MIVYSRIDNENDILRSMVKYITCMYNSVIDSNKGKPSNCAFHKTIKLCKSSQFLKLVNFYSVFYHH